MAIYFFFGENEALMKRAVKKIVEGKNPQHFWEPLAADEIEIIHALQSPGLFGGNIVLIEQLSFRAGWEALQAALAEADGDVVITSTKPDKRKKLYKWLMKNATTQEFPAFDVPECIAFIKKECEEKGVSIEQKAAEYIAVAVNANAALAEKEIEKMSTLGETITKEHAIALTAARPISEVFALIDAVAEKQLQKALIYVKNIDDSGDYFLPIVAALSSQLSLIAAAHTGTVSAKALAETVGVHPFPAQKAVRAAAQLPRPKVTAAIHSLARLTEDIVSGRVASSARNQSDVLYTARVNY